MKTKQCLQCKGDMPPKRHDAKFCTDKCRSDYNNQLRREGIQLGVIEPKRVYHSPKPCAVCAKVFKPARSTNNYCSAGCRAKRNNTVRAPKKNIDVSINDLL